MKHSIKLLLAVAIFSLLNCSRMQRVENDTSQTKKDVKQIEKEVQAVLKAVEDLNMNTGGATSKMKADLTMMLKSLDTQLEKLKAELDESQYRFKQLEEKIDVLSNQRLLTTTSNADSTDSTGTVSNKMVAGLDIEKMYNTARDDYLNGKYKLAFKGFKSVYEAKETHRFRDNALYWMGECFYKKKDWKNALKYYSLCIKEFPKGNKACSAYFKLGLVHQELKDKKSRTKAWDALLKQCPTENQTLRVKEILKNEAEAAE